MLDTKIQSVDSVLFEEHYAETLPIAIIGMGCRFADASDPFRFWRRLCDGEEFTRDVTAADLEAAGLDSALLDRPDFVARTSDLKDAQHFDAEFFGYSEGEASQIDPQQRLFLTCAWEALEMSGQNAQGLAAHVGVYGSARLSTYVHGQREDILHVSDPANFQKLIGNDKDYIASRTAYKLGLKGPAATVQTACSSSLVAVHMACEALRSGECDLALAGGAALSFPMGVGYVHRPGMIFSGDGKCRPFDAAADGTFMGNGVGVVALKPLHSALEAGDPVIAVIRGGAVNNDGAEKAGFTAPSLTGQKTVIQEAVELSGIDSSDIGYVECHGTATPLGDPIEVQALQQAYDRAATENCALGSVKANTGHLDTVAGVASLIKAAFAVRYGLIPPCLNFETPNPALNLHNSPFYVPKSLTPWDQQRRIAAVSSFGIGGTNSHMVVENLPDAFRPVTETDPSSIVLHLSARDEAALKELAETHAEFLIDTPPAEGVAAYCATVSNARTDLPVSLVLEADDLDDLIGRLQDVAQFGPVPVNETSEIPLPQPVGARAFAPVARLHGRKMSNEAGKDVAQQYWAQRTKTVQSAAETLSQNYDWTSLTREATATTEFHKHFVGAALVELGVFANDAEMLSVADIMERGGIPGRQTQLMHRLMRDLAEAGGCQRKGDLFGGLTLPNPDEIAALTAEVRAQGYQRLADLAERAGPHLAQMLTGAVDPVSIVFPEGSSDDVEDMYERQRDSLFLNSVAADFVSKWAKDQPKTRKLRVLEIGAGTGGTTSALLPHLGGLNVEYVFTDIGGLFLRRAETKFADYPFLSFKPFDFEKPARAQGVEPGSFDLIVAANVIHNANDLKRSLGDLRSLLVPGGTLMLREIAERKPLFDMIFGPLAPQTSDNAWRNGELFPSLDNWREAATQGGFSDFITAPEVNSPSDRLGEYIMLAQADSSAADEAPKVVVQQVSTAAQALAAVLSQPSATPSTTYALRLGAQGADWARREAGVTPQGKPPALNRSTALPCPDGWSDIAQHIPAFNAETAQVDIAALHHLSAPQTKQLWLQPVDTGYVIFDDLEWPCLVLNGVSKASEQAALYEWHWQRVTPRSTPLTSYQLIAPFGQTLPDVKASSADVMVVDLCKAPKGDLVDLYSQITRLIAEQARGAASLIFVTKGAVRATSWDDFSTAELAGLVPLLRVAAREYTDQKIAVLDVDTCDDPQQLARALAAALEFDQVALRQTSLLSAKLQRSGPSQALPIQKGLYVLSGGLSPLGLETAQWLADQGASDLWLIARRKPSKDEAAKLARLTEAGVSVKVWDDVDLAQSSWPKRLKKALSGQKAPLRAVLHLAGSLTDAPIARLTEQDLHETLAAKVDGAARWAEICRDHPGAKLVLYSSAATVFGPPGQASHAIANGLLEGMAQQSAGDGAQIQTLSWGYWNEKRADRAALEASFRSNGMDGLELSQGFDLLARALGSAAPVLVPMSVDWGKMSARAELPHALSDFAVSAAEKPSSAINSPAMSADLGAIRTEIAALLQVNPDEIAADENLIRLGFDSLMLLDLRQRLKDIFGVEIAADAAMEADTLAKLEAYFAEHVTVTNGQANKVEAVILAETAALLQVEVSELDPHENLVRLGLDSLMMLDLGERLHGALGVRISAEMTLTHDTIANLSQAVADMLGAEAVTAEESDIRQALRTAHPQALLENGDLRPERKGQAHNLSDLQNHWLHGRETGNGFGATARHLYVEYDKPRAIFDVSAFEAAWNYVLARHDILRSTVSDGVVTTLPEVPPYQIPHLDLSDKDPAEAGDHLTRIREEMSNQRFDLAQWPFFDLRVSHIDAETLRLHIDIDTTLVDVESFQIILREIGSHMVSGGSVTLPDFQFSMADYRHGIELLNGTELMGQQQALVQEADPHVSPNLPVETTEPAAKAKIGIIRNVFARDAWLSLRDHAEGRDLTPTHAVLAIYAAVLEGWSEDQRNFSINLDFFDRKPLHIEMMNVVGDASATLPIRCAVTRTASLTDLAKTIRDEIGQGLRHDLIDGAQVLSGQNGWGHGFTLPVGFTSLMGVRKAYAVPETPDPTLGMPSYEYAIQPGQALHLQALEEESALMYNLDWVKGVIPDLMAEALMLSIDSVMTRLSDSAQAWDQPLQELLPKDPEIAAFLADIPHRLPEISSKRAQP